MIRKAIIVVLTLAAIVTAVLLVVSFTGRPTGLPGLDRGWGKSFGEPKDDPWIVIGASKGQLNVAHFARVDPSIVISEETLGIPYLFVRKQTILPSSAVAITKKQILMRKVSAPLWLLFPLFAAYPIIAFLRGPYRRWRRPRKWQCIHCGYDLTGNVSGVCPECGKQVGRRESFGAE